MTTSLTDSLFHALVSGHLDLCLACTPPGEQASYRSRRRLTPTTVVCALLLQGVLGTCIIGLGYVKKYSKVESEYSTLPTLRLAVISSNVFSIP